MYTITRVVLSVRYWLLAISYWHWLTANRQKFTRTAQTGLPDHACGRANRMQYNRGVEKISGARVFRCWFLVPGWDCSRRCVSRRLVPDLIREAQRRSTCSELDSEALIFNMRSMLKILLTHFFEQSLLARSEAAHIGQQETRNQKRETPETQKQYPLSCFYHNLCGRSCNLSPF